MISTPLSSTNSALEEKTHDNRIIAARREFQSVFLNVAKSKRNWQYIAFAAMTLLLVREVSYQRYAAGSRIVPYVVEVDKFGRANAFGPAEPLKTTDRRVIVAQLSGFVRNIRMIVPDVRAQVDIMRTAYAFVDQNAGAFLNNYFSAPANDPRLLGREISRIVDIESILQVPGANTWKVQWVETELPHQGSRETTTTAWEAYLTTQIVPPSTTETIQVNPIGLYITAITWTPIRRGSSAEAANATTTP